MSHGRSDRSVALRGLLAIVASFGVLVSFTATAQPTYRSSDEIQPGYEGWRRHADGTFGFIFGYMNENWEEQPDIEVGTNNFLQSRGSRPRPTNPLSAKTQPLYL